MSPLSILFSPVEKLSRLNQKRNMYFVCKTETVKKNMLMDYDVCDDYRDGLFYWRKSYELLWTHILARSNVLS